MALTRKSEEISFTSTTFEVSVIVETTSTGRLRSLDQTQELDRNVTCDVGATTGNSGVLNCRPQSGGSLTPRKINFLTPNISGIPEDAPVQTNPNPDYSKNETLKIVDGLPIVTITNVSSNNCSANGSFVIDANSTKQFDWTSKTNISISFSTPDSSGLCKVNVLSDKRTLKMDCENTESFTASEIIIGSQIVYDDDDVTQIFRISQDYTAPVQFACAISDRSLRIAFATNSNPNATNATNSTVTDTTGSSDNTDTTSRNSNNARFSRANSSKGLSGGAIAGIVVSCVVVVAIVGVLIALVQKGTFAGAGAAAASSGNDVLDNSSTVNQFNINKINRI